MIGEPRSESRLITLDVSHLMSSTTSSGRPKPARNAVRRGTARCCPAAGDVESAVVQAVLVCAALGAFPGTELRRRHVQACEGVTQAFAALLECVSGAPGERVAQLVGVCWELAEDLRKVPCDNKTALTRALVRLMKGILAAVEEIQQDVEDEEEEEEGRGARKGVGDPSKVDPEDGSEAGSDDDVIDLTGAGRLTEQERAAREEARGLCEACAGIAKTVMRAVLTSGGVDLRVHVTCHPIGWVQGPRDYHP